MRYATRLFWHYGLHKTSDAGGRIKVTFMRRDAFGLFGAPAPTAMAAVEHPPQATAAHFRIYNGQQISCAGNGIPLESRIAIWQMLNT
jgi:hypothetical protein